MPEHILGPVKPQLIGDPRIRAAETALAKHLTQYVGAPITEGLVKMLQEGVNELRATAAIRGIKLPKMVVVALPQSGFIQVWPRDMEHKDLQIRLRNLINHLGVRGRPVDANELAKAIRRAYPDYSPSTTRLKLN